MTRGDTRVLERVADATRLCNFAGGIPKSIFFGLEKSGGQQLIGTAEQIFTGESKVFQGPRSTSDASPLFKYPRHGLKTPAHQTSIALLN
jgi:hypothetical protein